MTCGLAFTACTVEDNPNPLPLGQPDPDEWEFSFQALNDKYAEKTGVTISAAVSDGLGTCSIVGGTLKEPAEDGATTASETIEERFGLQTGTSWIIMDNKGAKGLYSANSGDRSFGIFNAKKDQVITLEMTAQPTITGGNAELMSKTDSSYVYYVSADCNVVFKVARYTTIKNVSVKKFYGAEYTVKFVNEKGEKVKDDVKHQGYIGKPVELWPSDIAAIPLAEGGRLLFKEADNTAENVVKKDGSTVVTVIFRPAEKLYAVLNCMAGSTLLYQFKDDDKYFFYEGDQLTIYPSRGYMKDAAAYFTPVNNNSGKYNGCEFTFPGTITPKVVDGKTMYIGTMSYEKVDSVVYYSDFETLALPKEDAGFGIGLGQLFGTVNSWYSFSGGIFNRFSGGRGIRLDKDSYVWTAPIAEEGTYKVTIYGRNDVAHNKKGINVPQPYLIGVRDANGTVTWLTDVTVPDWADSTTGPNVVEGVKIPAGNSLVIGCDGSTVTFPDGTELPKSISLDDIAISKTAAQ